MMLEVSIFVFFQFLEGFPMLLWHLQDVDAMMHMLVAPDGCGGELHTFAAPPVEQELHRDNADDGLEGHVRYVRASKSSPLVCWLQVTRVSRRWCVREGLASDRGCW
jgi:hypothetical protein